MGPGGRNTGGRYRNGSAPREAETFRPFSPTHRRAHPPSAERIPHTSHGTRCVNRRNGSLPISTPVPCHPKHDNASTSTKTALATPVPRLPGPEFPASIHGIPECPVRLERQHIRRRYRHALPVRGLRPDRAGRLLVVNVPNPAIRTFSPSASASPVASDTASTAPVAAVCSTPSRWPTDRRSRICSPTRSPESERARIRVVPHVRTRQPGIIARTRQADHADRPIRHPALATCATAGASAAVHATTRFQVRQRTRGRLCEGCSLGD